MTEKKEKTKMQKTLITACSFGLLIDLVCSLIWSVAPVKVLHNNRSNPERNN